MIVTSRFILGQLDDNYELLGTANFRQFDAIVRRGGVEIGKVFEVWVNGREVTFNMDIEDGVIDLESPPIGTPGITFRDGAHEIESVGFIAEKSWLHTCNYCGLKRLEREAELNGMKVTVQSSVDDVGYDVYVHPPDMEMPEHIRGGCDGKHAPGECDAKDLPEIIYWKSWLFSNYLERGCFCHD